MDENGIISVVALSISIIGSILGVINHRRIRSHCCGRDLVASLDVEATTPPKEDLKITIPKEYEYPPLPPTPSIKRII